MIRRITLENFMSHARTVIELADGLTVLAGPNNCGKSAVVEALRTVCLNQPAEAFVRHGEKESRITIETDDGHVVVWRRKGATVSYVIDGQPIHRLGRDVPENLHKILKLGRVTMPQGEPVEIHFASQKEPIFLLGEASRAANFFSAASDARKLMEMQSRHREKVREAKVRHRDLSEELKRSAAQVAGLAAVDEIEPKMQAAEEEHRAMQALREQIAAREREIRTLTSAMEREELCRARLNALADLRSMPALVDDAPLAMLIVQMERTQAQQRLQCERLSALERLVEPPAMRDEADLVQLCAGLENGLRQARRAGALCSLLDRLSPAPELPDTQILGQCVRDLEAAMTRYQRATERVGALAGLREPPATVQTDERERLLAQAEQAGQAAARHAAEIIEIERAMAQVRRQVDDWAAAHPTCPVCGSTVDSDKVLSREHEHG